MAYRVDITLQGYKCLRCNHSWIPRIITTELPIVCPKCHSPYWRKAKKKSK